MQAFCVLRPAMLDDVPIERVKARPGRICGLATMSRSREVSAACAGWLPPRRVTGTIARLEAASEHVSRSSDYPPHERRSA